MRDETPDSMLEAVESGKITWNVAWDGKPGRIATRWAVDGFPEVYVIDQHGVVAGVGLRGKMLKAKVAELIETGQ